MVTLPRVVSGSEWSGQNVSSSPHHNTTFCLVGLVALVLAGCSTVIPLPGIISPEDVTGSIRAFSSPLSPTLGLEDWRRAVAALGVALDPQGNGTRVAWDNPQSGLKGAFTPVGGVYPAQNRMCRAFLGEIGQDEAVHGTGCRDANGDWTVLDVKPWISG